MKAAGIIAEYNPFHNGHAYHIRETRRISGADYIIVIMSGDFVQRGGPAVMDKYARAQMALLCGADLVLEMPVCGAAASAETFARCGISILDAINVVSAVSFGCESADEYGQHMLKKLAVFLADEPDAYRQELKKHLKSGDAFPLAREKALSRFINGAEGFLRQPNNILAIEYLKALRHHGSRISPVFIGRAGSDYHSPLPSGPLTSATAIRAILTDADVSCRDNPHPVSAIRPFVPEETLPVYRNWQETAAFLSEDDFSQLLSYALHTGTGQLAGMFPSEAGLVRRTQKLLEQYRNFESFAQLLKSRDRTLTAVRRFLTRVLLQIDDHACSTLSSVRYAPYARLLGFRKTASGLVDRIQKQAGIPVILALRKGEKQLSPDSGARLLLQADLRASDIYRIPLKERSGVCLPNDYRHPLIYL